VERRDIQGCGATMSILPRRFSVFQVSCELPLLGLCMCWRLPRRSTLPRPLTHSRPRPISPLHLHFTHPPYYSTYYPHSIPLGNHLIKEASSRDLSQSSGDSHRQPPTFLFVFRPASPYHSERVEVLPSYSPPPFLFLHRNTVVHSWPGTRYSSEKQVAKKHRRSSRCQREGSLPSL
jgi:hypothetical protein